MWEGLRLANTGLIAGDMVAVSVEGSPTWDQPENGSVPELDDVPFLHAYAFLDESAGAASANVLVINRNTTRSLPFSMELPFVPATSVTSLKLAGDTPESNNEDEEKVTIVQTVIEDYKPGQSLKAPPASATVYRFTEAH